jgi:hypothetical protein
LNLTDDNIPNSDISSKLGIISEVSFETISSILNKLKLGLSLSGKERSQIIKIIGKAPTYSGTWTRYSNLIKSIKFGYELRF